MSLEPNIILRSDSYKAGHYKMYPPNTTWMTSYLESRGGRFGETLFFGLQYLLKEYLSRPVTQAMVDEAAAFFAAHGEPFPRAGWERIAGPLGGKLPIRIRAVPEGTVVPTRNVLMTVESTDAETFWVTSWLETILLRGCWYPITVATTSYYCKKTILEFLQDTADDALGEIDFKLHDFGGRGVSSGESAGIGGMAHLVNFKGSDTVEGVRFANHYYDCQMAAISIPAAEHSTITMWGREREAGAYRNMLDQFAKPGAILACVSDSYNIYNAIENIWGDELRDRVAKSGATVVIRPDSGNPPEVVLKCLQILERKVGMQKNMKGFKVLPKYFRLIQGDGIDHESIGEILQTIKAHGYSASNVAFGMGGALLQKLDRDTQRFAFKCSAAIVDGVEIPVSKNPVTDHGKASKAGRLDLVRENGHYETVAGPRNNSELVTVFENGEIKKTWTLEEVRKRAMRGLL